MRSTLAAVGSAVLALAGCVNDVELVHAPSGLGSRATHWTPVSSATSSDLHRAWGSAADDVWAVGDGGTAIHWDGRAWRVVPTGTSATLTGVWVASATDAWAVGVEGGRPIILRWDGARWSDVPLSPRDRARFRAVWGTSPTDIWAVGSSPEFSENSLWRWNGTQWRPEPLPGPRTPELSSIGGRAPDDLWAVGSGPTLFHRVGSGWSPPVVPPRGVQFAGELCVTTDGEVWVTSPTSAIHRYAVATWTSMPLDPSTTLRGLWCGSGDDVWGVGDGGRIAHWDGTAWSSETVGSANLAAVWDSDAGERWAVGAQGTVLRNGP